MTADDLLTEAQSVLPHRPAPVVQELDGELAAGRLTCSGRLTDARRAV